MVDRLSKYAHFISPSHPLTASVIAQVFVDQVYKLHGAPTNIISDRDPSFISKFWREFIRQLGVEQNLSSSYHPQSDGQSEVLNRCLESYLRLFTWQYPHSWSRWLYLAEWWYNTTYLTSTNMTPYEVVYGQVPPIHLPYVPHDSCIDAIDRSITAREEMMRALKENLRKAVHKMKQRADKGRSDREYKVGEWVFLKLQ